MTTTNQSQSLVLVNKQNGIVVIPVGSPLTRLNYFDGKFLRASDLKAEQDYLRQLVQQSNQAGGSGVAHGYDVNLGTGDMLNIGPGLAIDGQGRVLLLPQATSINIQTLIEKSSGQESPSGKQAGESGDFGDCFIADATPPDQTTMATPLYAIVICAAEAYCGEEAVYGRLCEEACSTSTDRPLIIEGLVVRAIPLPLKLPLPDSKVIPLGKIHYRSRIASAHFEYERRQVASLISAEGLKQATWCMGADAGAGGCVPIAVVARAGSTTVFLDPWIARRELIDTPARRYWQWRMMMRPWDVFLAQILQFQCQLRDLGGAVPGGDGDPCSDARDALNEASAVIADFKKYYETTSTQFPEYAGKIGTFEGGTERLVLLNDKLDSIYKVMTATPTERWLINSGIIELPSAGYLPVVPGAALTVDQQVRKMMGEGVDLRFCVVRPDFVAHALEEAQHMERISLIDGLESGAKKPEVDILVPDGEIVTPTPQPVTLHAFAVTGQITQEMKSVGESTGETTTPLPVVSVEGAARYETLPSGGSVVYLSCSSQQGYMPALNTEFSKQKWLAQSKLPDPALPGEPPLGLWISIKCNVDLLNAKQNDVINVNGEAYVGARIAGAGTSLQFSGTLDGTLTAKTIQGGKYHPIGGDGLINYDVSLSQIQKKSTETFESFTQNSQNYSQIYLVRQPGSLPMVNFAFEIRRSAGLKPEFWINVARPGQSCQIWLKTNFDETEDVFAPANTFRVRAVQSLKVISEAKKDATFATEKEKLLFPAQPPKPASEPSVRATRDWVLFHRRRTKQCELEATTDRRYRVYQAIPGYEYGNPEERIPKKPLTAADILKISPELPGKVNLIGFVTFAGGKSTMVGDIGALKNAWIKVPGGMILWGAIGSHADAANDGQSLALARLAALETGLDQVSPQARNDVLPIVPPSLDSPDIDGVILLINDRYLYSYYYGYYGLATGIGAPNL
jgi:hypothetical protein